jgi:hypothetical protein
MLRYDYFRIDPDGPLWLGATDNIEEVVERIREHSAESQGEFCVVLGELVRCRSSTQCHIVTPKQNNNSPATGFTKPHSADQESEAEL